MEQMMNTKTNPFDITSKFTFSIDNMNQNLNLDFIEQRKIRQDLKNSEEENLFLQNKIESLILDKVPFIIT